jgi:hypothetical protein
MSLARRLYAKGNPTPWPDVNLPGRWHLNSRRVPVPHVLRDGPERVREIRRRRALLPQALRCDPAFNIASPNWDTFSRWELRPDRRAGYLGEADWDPNWAPIASSDDEGDNGEDEYDSGGDEDADADEDFHKHGA